MKNVYILENLSTGETFVFQSVKTAKEYIIWSLTTSWNYINDEVEKEKIDLDIELIEEHAEKYNGEFDTYYARCYKAPLMD